MSSCEGENVPPHQFSEIYMESGDEELVLSVAFVLVIENTTKLFTATPNPKGKYCC